MPRKLLVGHPAPPRRIRVDRFRRRGYVAPSQNRTTPAPRTRPSARAYRMTIRTGPFVGVAAVLLLDVQAAVAQAGRAPKPLAPLKVIDTSYMDRSVKACVDFFSFANGAWVKRDTIPPDYSSAGVSRD